MQAKLTEILKGVEMKTKGVHSAFRLVLSAFACMTMASCGGGGGDGGGSSVPSNQILQLSHTEINLTAPSTGNGPLDVVLQGTVSGSPSQIYAFVEYTNTGISEVSQPLVGQSGAVAYVRPRAPLALGHGIYRDTITIRACLDAGCKQHYHGSPAVIPVTYKVGLPVTPATVTLQQVEGAASLPSQQLSIDSFASDNSWTAAEPSTGTPAGWLKLSAASGPRFPASLLVSADPRPVGEYTAQVELRAILPFNNTVVDGRVIPVSYSVLPLLSASAPAGFEVTDSNGPAGQTRSLSIASRDSTRQTAWSASIPTPKPWLRLLTATGHTATSGSGLQVELIPEEIAALENGTHNIDVVVTPSVTGSPVSVHFALSLNRATSSTVVPRTSLAGRSETVTITGIGFNAAAVTAVRFGNVLASSFTVLSSTRISATHPALSAGSYPVTIQATSRTLDSSAVLTVKAAANIAAAGVGTSPIGDFASFSFFDRQDNACYFFHGSQVGKTYLSGAAWQTLVGPALSPQPYGVAMSADGTSIMVLYRDQIVYLSPATLQVMRTEPLASPINGVFYIPGFVATENGGALINAGAEGILHYMPRQGVVGRSLLSENIYAVYGSFSGNKSLLFIQGGVNLPTVVSVDSATMATTTAVETRGAGSEPASDRFATRWAIAGDPTNTSTQQIELIDATGRRLATISNIVAQSVALSNDGRVLVVTTGFGSSQEMSVYDLVPNGSLVTPTLRRSLSASRALSKPNFSLDEREIVFCSPTAVHGVAVP